MSTQPPQTCLSMPCFCIQTTRAATSESGFETGRVGLPPAKAKARLPASSMTRTLGKRTCSLRMASSRLAGARWAWASTIIRRVSLVAGSGDHVAKLRDFHRELADGNAERLERVVDRARERRRRAEIAGFAGAFLPEHGVRRGCAVMHDLDVGHLVRGGEQIIHEALRNHLAFVVIGEFFVERRADTVGDAAHGHAAHDLRID